MERRVLLKINMRIKAQGAILKSLKGKLIADFRHKNAKVQVRHKTLSWPEAVRKGQVYVYGLSQMEARILRVKLHQKLTSIISVALNKGSWRQRKDYFNINSVILRKGASKKNLKSAIQEVINSVNKLSCSPKQQDKECSLCVKFNIAVEVQ